MDCGDRTLWRKGLINNFPNKTGQHFYTDLIREKDSRVCEEYQQTETLVSQTNDL